MNEDRCVISPYKVIVVTADDSSAEFISKSFSENPRIKAEAVSKEELLSKGNNFVLDKYDAIVFTDTAKACLAHENETLLKSSLPTVTVRESLLDHGDGLITDFEDFLLELAERLNLKNALRQKDKDMVRIIEKSADSILVSDEDGKVVFMNPAAKAMFGGSLSFGDDFGYPVVRGETTEIDLIGTGGIRYVAEMRATSIEWSGKPCRLAILRDVTERKITEEALERMVLDRTADLEAANAQLTQMYRISERAVHLRSQFIANVSHEIRTPLSGIVSGAELLCESEDLESARELGKVMFDSARRLLSLVNEILDFAKIERGDTHLNENKFDVKLLVGQLITEMQAMADQRELRLLANLSPKLESAYIGDSGKLHQILLNLLHNALKFTKDGGVIVSAQPGEKQEVIFSVRDTGSGIEERDLPLIFQPFVQGSIYSGRDNGGTGLGLSICSQLAKSLGGSISCQSKVGEGSTFTLRIPLKVYSGAD